MSQTNVRSRPIKRDKVSEYLTGLAPKPFESHGKLLTDTMAQFHSRIEEIRAMNQPENARDRFARLFNS
jgi:hypothetical protein